MKFLFRTLSSAFSLLGLLILTGCGKEEPAPVICSCDGRGNETFQDIPAIVVSTTEGYFLLSPYTGYYKPCEPLDPSLEVDGLMGNISGVTRATCEKPDDAFKMEQQSYSALSGYVVSTDSLFAGPPFQIRIIKSEDYGLSPGFGYKITHVSGFKIEQKIIPAIAGLNPFKTPTDAFKTAVLVAYKINLEIGLPFITEQDLYFLQISY